MKSTIGYFAAFIALGLATAILGPTLPYLAERTNSTLSQTSVLFLASSVGYLAGALLSGRLYDRLPGHQVMSLVLLGMTIFMLLIPGVSVLWLLGGLILGKGLIEAAVDVGGNAMIVWVHGKGVGPYMNALHFFFGVGAALTPVIFALSLKLTDGINAGFYVLALLVAPAAVWVFLQPSPLHPSAHHHDTAVRTNPVVLLLVALCLFFYVGGEIGYGNWIFSYTKAQGLGDDGMAALLNSAFWGALTAGRLLSIPLAMRFSARRILQGDLLICLLSLGVLLLWPDSLAATWIGTLGLGLGMASIFPTTITLAEQRMTITGQVTSLFFVGSSLGGMVLPWLIGQVFEPLGPTSMVMLVLVDLLVALVLYLMLIFRVHTAPVENPA